MSEPVLPTTKIDMIEGYVVSPENYMAEMEKFKTRYPDALIMKRIETVSFETISADQLINGIIQKIPQQVLLISGVVFFKAEPKKPQTTIIGG